jgi:hypothetical protein
MKSSSTSTTSTPRPFCYCFALKNIFYPKALKICANDIKNVCEISPSAFPIPNSYTSPFHTVCSSHKYFATFPLEGAIHGAETRLDGGRSGENSQEEYKNYLSYVHFLSSSSVSVESGSRVRDRASRANS